MKRFIQFLLTDNVAIASGLINPNEIIDVFIWDGKSLTAQKIMKAIKKWVDEAIVVSRKGKDLVLRYLNGDTRKIKPNGVLVVYYGYIDIINLD